MPALEFPLNIDNDNVQPEPDGNYPLNSIHALRAYLTIVTGTSYDAWNDSTMVLTALYLLNLQGHDFPAGLGHRAAIEVPVEEV